MTQTATMTRAERANQRNAVLAGFLGWTLDAFDFFILTLVIDDVARSFGRTRPQIFLAITLALAMRPVGAIIFGIMADRWGRRIPLMLNVIFYALISVLSGLAPSYQIFLILRMLFGVGMGGEWGVGASLAMEAAPKRLRGVLSGLLQSGYPIGNLLAALAAKTILPHWGWRPVFWVGALPALLALYIRTKVPESAAWKENRVETTGQVLKTVGRDWKLFLYLVVLMTFMMFLSHGTQDLYPDFLKEVHKVSDSVRANIVIIANLGAVAGAVIFGQLSQMAGRRKGMLAALLLALCVIPLWAYGSGLPMLVLGAFLMQAGVQGAWGVIPIHLNELSAAAARGLMPGLAYQLGILIASPTNLIQYALYGRFGYQAALAGFEVCTIMALSLLLWRGIEAHNKDFHHG